MSRTPWWRVLAPVVVGGTFLVLTALERRRPLRRVREAKWRHVSRNIVFAGAHALRIWQNLLLLSILFHHSNVERPIDMERFVARLVVTPRIHGIHHSIVPEETHSNWSSGLTVWDYLHGTLRLDVPQQAITIGVPAYPTPADVTLANSFVLPFGAQRPWRAFPGDGEPEPPRRAPTVNELIP